MQNNETKKLTADKLYATYWWLIQLNPQHAMNQPGIFEMTGYSKFQGQDEAKDKEYLLMSKILMLISRGYHERSKKIELFYRDGIVINKTAAPLIVTLYPNDFAYSTEFLKPKYHEWHKFTSNLYEALKSGKGVKHLLPQKKAGFSKDSYFDINLLNFTSEMQLNNYCTKLGRNGHPFDMIAKFHREYLHKKPFHQ